MKDRLTECDHGYKPALVGAARAQHPGSEALGHGLLELPAGIAPVAYEFLAAAERDRLVSATINTMLTGAGEAGALPDPGDVLNPQQFIAGGAGTLVQDSNRKPWNGDYVTSTGDLVEDRPTTSSSRPGARNNKLKVYEMIGHPAARALTGYLLVRGGVHQVAYARAVENLTGADLSKLFPAPRIPTDRIPECQPHIERGEHKKLYRFSPSDYQELAAVFNGPHAETGDELEVVDDHREGAPPFDLPAQEGVFAPDDAPEEIAEIARKLRQAAGLPKRLYRAKSRLGGCASCGWVGTRWERECPFCCPRLSDGAQPNGGWRMTFGRRNRRSIRDTPGELVIDPGRSARPSACA